MHVCVHACVCVCVCVCLLACVYVCAQASGVSNLLPRAVASEMRVSSIRASLS